MAQLSPYQRQSQRCFVVNSLKFPWPSQSAAAAPSREDVLSRAIEESDDGALSLLRKWGTGELIYLKRDSRGLGALHVAVLWGRYWTLLVLLQSGAVDVNQGSRNPAKKGWTALHFAAFLLDLRAIDILLKHGCDSTVVTQLESTPLHFVTGRFGARGNAELVYTVIRTLIGAGVDPAATNSYGYTVMHESILWSDATSLAVMLRQNTAQFFEKLLLIGSTVLPHELCLKSQTLPQIFKNHLEKSYLHLKMTKESAGMIRNLSPHDFQVYKAIEFIANPSPDTVVRKCFPHPEALTPVEIGSLLHTASPGLVVAALQHQGAIQEYRHCNTGESHYAFPAYFPTRLPHWVCVDCRACCIIAGRWLEMTTETESKNILVRLMTEVLSNTLINKSAPLQGNTAFFFTQEQVQCRIQYVDRVRSLGVLIQVCCESLTRETVTKCRSVLQSVLQLVFLLKSQGHITQVGIVSSRDLRVGLRIPHIFSFADVQHARATNKTFLSNPSNLNTAETFLDLLLCDFTEEAEVPGALGEDPHTVAKKSPYRHSSDVWRPAVYERAVQNCNRDLNELMDPGLVAKHLLDRRVLLLSECEAVSSSSNGCKRLLSIVADRQAYHHLHLALLQTGAQTSRHQQLWDILSRACDEIEHAGSLSDYADVYLGEHGAMRLTPIPEEATSTSVPRRYTGNREGITEERRESGYRTQSPVWSRDPSTFLSSRSSHRRRDLDSAISESPCMMMTFSPEDAFELSHFHEKEVSPDCLHESRDVQPETDGVASSLKATKTSVGNPKSPSSPIDVPTRNSSTTSLAKLSDSTTVAAGVAGQNDVDRKSSPPSSPKYLSCDKKLSFLERFLSKIFAPPSDDTQDTYNGLPGIKLL